MHRVAVLAVPAVKPFDLSMPSTLLGAAELGGRPGYEVTVCTAMPGTVAASGGIEVVIRHGLQMVAAADTVIVPSTASRHDAEPAALDALREAAAAGKRVASICSGAFVLAQAGLLDGRVATTHWALAEELQRAFPAVRVDADRLFAEDGRILTGAGSAAGIDLCLHLISSDYGAAVASTAARAAVVTPVRHGGQAQFVQTPLPAETDSSLDAARIWALQHLDRPISARPGRSGQGQCADPDPPLHSRDWCDPVPMAAPAAAAAGPRAAGDHRSHHRPCGPAQWSRLRRVAPPAPESPDRHDPGSLPRRLHPAPEREDRSVTARLGPDVAFHRWLSRPQVSPGIDRSLNRSARTRPRR